MDDLLVTLKCHFTKLVSWHVNRLMYFVKTAEVLVELTKIKRYIFYLQSGCAKSSTFYNEIFAYTQTLTYISGPCINCEENEFFNRQFS